MAVGLSLERVDCQLSRAHGVGQVGFDRLVGVRFFGIFAVFPVPEAGV